MIEQAEIVVVHWYDHPLLRSLVAQTWPAARVIFWCHKNYNVSEWALSYPDLFLNVSPIQGQGKDYIWSTEDMSRFRAIKPKEHEGFNIGYVGTVDFKKLHPDFLKMCSRITDLVPDVRFNIIGENHLDKTWIHRHNEHFIGQVDDVAPYLAEMDLFMYPLRRNHYGTCEQALGEAMSAGVVPVVMNNGAEGIIVTDGLTGAVLSDVSQLISNVKILYEHVGLRKAISSRAREAARVRYDINVTVRNWERVFDKIMKQPKKERDRV
jgi:glycosyltransferase involved in cell wall biosynthesis